MLTRALALLLRSADGAGVLTVGGVLTLLTWTVTPLWVVSTVAFPPLIAVAPLALAPAFVTRGYFIRVLSDAVETENTGGAPPFVAWNELYRDGVKSTVLSVILLAPLALLFVLVGLAGFALGTDLVDPTAITARVEDVLGAGGTAAAIGLGTGTLAVVSAAYLVVFAYVRPAALAVFAASGRFRNGLHPKRVRRVAGSGTYATAWLVATVTMLIGYAIATPFLPVLIGVVIIFLTRIVVYALYGHGAGPILSDEERTAVGENRSAHSAVLQPSPPEAVPAVQTGRAVPFGGDLSGLIESDDNRASDGVGGSTEDGCSAAFEWATDVEDKRFTDSDKRLIGDRADDVARKNRLDDGRGDNNNSSDDNANSVRFDWGPSDGTAEDKS